MNQKKLFETTRNATDQSLKFTNSMIEKSKKLRTPSPKVDKIGTTVGSWVIAFWCYCYIYVQAILGNRFINRRDRYAGIKLYLSS